MTSTENERVSRYLGRRLLAPAIAVGLLIGVGFPGLFYAVQRYGLERTATFYAGGLADQFKSVILEAPALWKYQTYKYAQILRGFTPGKDITLIHIRDERGHPIGAYEYDTPESERWWNRFAPVGSAPIVFNNRVLGAVEVHVSQSTLLRASAQVFLFSISVGAGLAILMYWFPLIVVRRVERRVHDLVGDLERSNTALNQRANEAEELAQVIRSLTERLEVDAVATRIVNGVRRLLRTAESTLFRQQHEGSLEVVAVSSGDGDTRKRGYVLPPGVGVVGRAVESGGPVYCADLLNGERLIDMEAHREFIGLGIRSVLCTPIRSKGRIVGALGVGDEVGRVFTEADISLLQTFGDHAALALENARLFEETVALLRIAQTLGSTLDLKPLLREVAQRTAQALEVERCSINLFQEGYVVPIASEFADGHTDATLWEKFKRLGPRRVEDVPAHSKAVEGKGPVVVENAETSDLAPAYWRDFGIKSALVVPLIRRDEVVGTMNLDNTTAVHNFAEGEIRLAMTIGSQVALALDNAQLHQETERRLRETRALLEVAEVFTSTLELRPLLRELAQRTAQAVEMERCSIFLWHQGKVRAVMSQFADGHEAPELWQAFKGIESDRVEAIPVFAKAIRLARPVLIEDATASDLIPASWVAIFEVKNVLVVPLIRQNEVVGVLHLDNTTESRPITPEQISLAMTIASQVALALENARLFEEMGRRTREIQALYTIANTITHSLSIEPILQSALLKTIEILQLDAGRVYLLDEKDQMLRLNAHHGLPVDMLDDYESYAPGEGIVGRIFRERRPIVFADIASDPIYTAMARSGRGKACGFRSAAGLPITAKGRPIGVIYIFGRDVREFVPQDLELLAAIGGQIGVAVENARLYEETERHLQQTAGLLSVTQTLSGSLDSQEIARRTARQLTRLLGADTSIFFEIDEAGEVAPVAGYHVPQELRDPAYRMSWTDLPRSLLEGGATGMPVACSDVATDPRFDHPAIRSMPIQPRSLLLVPLQSKGRSLGAFVSYWWGEAHPFVEEELELAAAIASQTALALQNARLFEETERRRGEAEEFARIVGMLTESLDVSVVGQRIVESLLRLLAADSATLWLLQPDGSTLAAASAGAGRDRYPPGKAVMPRGMGMPGRAVREGAPVWSGDVLSDNIPYSEEIRNLFITEGSVAALAVPFRMQGKIIGALVASDRVGREFSDGEVSLLQTFASQAGLAFEQARLHEETDRRRREAEELARVARSLTESLDMTAVGERIATSVRELFGVRAAMLRLLQPDGSLRTLASSGEVLSQSSGGDALPPGAGLTGLAIAQGKPVWSADVLSEPEIPLTNEMRDHQLRSGNRSMIAVPLRAHEKIIGSLGLSDRTGRVYSDGEVELLQTFAAQGALALENARLFEETERRAQEISALHEIGTKLVSTLDLSAVLEEIAGSAIPLIGAQRCAVFELDPGDQRLHMRASRGMRPDQPFMPMKLGQGAAGSAALQRQPVFSPDVHSQPLPMYDEVWEEAGTTLREVVRRRGYRAILAVPLVSKETALGAICIYWDEIHAYDEREVQLLTALAQQAAVAIENARLFEETEHRAQEQAAVNAIATAVSQSLHLDELLQTALDRVLEVTGRECGYIRLKDSVAGEITLVSHRGISEEHVKALVHGRTPGGKSDRVFESGEPVIVNDPEETVLKAATRREGFRSIAWIPLKARGKVVGILNVATPRPIPFTPRDVELLQSIGNVIGMAVENARLFEETQRRNLELQALYTVTNTTTQSLDIKSLTQAALLTTIEVLGVDAGRLYVLDETECVLRLTAHHGLPVDELSDYECYAPEEGIVGRIFSQNRPVVFADLSSDPNYAAMARTARGKAWGFRSAAGLPITAKGQPVGVIYVNGRAVREFTPQDLKLLSVIGEQIGVALENARLYEETGRRRHEAEELADVARTLTESLDVRAVEERIVEGVRRLLGVVDATVFRLQADGSLMAVAMGNREGDSRKAGFVHPSGAGVVGRAVAAGGPVYCADLLEDTETAQNEHLRSLATSGIRTLLGIPLRSKGRIIGALGVGDQEGRTYTEADIALLQTFGDQAALALENARLYEAERTRQEELNAVRKVGQEVSTELELEPLLHLIVRRAVELAERSSGIVYTLEDEVLVPRAWWNLGPWLSEVRFRLGHGIPGIVAQSGEAMIVNDYLNSPYVSPLFKEHSKVTALVAMPLISKGKAVGVITINNSETNRRFTEADQAILSLFAPQAATAIENARLFKETERRRVEAEELAQVARSLTGSLEVEAVATRIVEGVRRLLGVAEATVFRLQTDGSLVSVALSGGDGRQAGFVLPPGVGLVGQAVARGEPVCCDDSLRDTDFEKNESMRFIATLGIRSLVAIPLRSKGQIIGALGVGDQVGRTYTDADIALLQTFGDQAALALENARLFEETRRLVGELGATTKELGAKNKELDTFVYTVSHDLKAPLVTLQGMADLLGESCEKDLDEQGRHYVTRIKANAQQMERLVQDLLALSRIGREGRAPEAVALDEVTEEILMEWGERIRARGVTVTRHELPTLWGVRTQIEQVVNNLLGNAIKYLGDTPAPVVEIGAKDGGGSMVECYVKDNGIGIDPAYHEKVFEIFQRLKETEAEGTGVGLAIVKKIVEGAGGVIWVESAKGQGATFRFTWPRGEVAA